MNDMLSAPAPAEGCAAVHSDAALLASACEHEKAQLARFIHDGLAQQLTVASLELSLWQHDVETGSALTFDSARAKISNLAALVSSMVATARSISGGLRPRSLDSFGFAAAVEGLVSKLGARLGGGCRFEQVGHDVTLSPERGIHFYRILDTVLATIQTPPAEGVVLELQNGRDTVEARIIANPLPQIPLEAAARLRAFQGRASIENGALHFEFPV
jgi:signal transduction histidine kinase